MLYYELHTTHHDMATAKWMRDIHDRTTVYNKLINHQHTLVHLTFLACWSETMLIGTKVTVVTCKSSAHYWIWTEVFSVSSRVLFEFDKWTYRHNMDVGYACLHLTREYYQPLLILTSAQFWLQTATFSGYLFLCCNLLKNSLQQTFTEIWMGHSNYLQRVKFTTCNNYF